MSKITLTGFALLLALFLGNSSGNYAAQSKQKTTDTLTGTLQRMIVESGSVTMQLDLDRLNGISSSVEAGGSPANPSDLQPARLPLQLHPPSCRSQEGRLAGGGRRFAQPGVQPFHPFTHSDFRRPSGGGLEFREISHVVALIASAPIAP